MARRLNHAEVFFCGALSIFARTESNSRGCFVFCGLFFKAARLGVLAVSVFFWDAVIDMSRPYVQNSARSTGSAFKSHPTSVNFLEIGGSDASIDGILSRKDGIGSV